MITVDSTPPSDPIAHALPTTFGRYLPQPDFAPMALADRDSRGIPMKMPRGYWIVTFAGVGIYMAAAFAPIVISPFFWTSHTIGSEVPWYFMGNAFIEGVAAAVALLLCAILGTVAARNLGTAVWGVLMPVFLFLSTPIGRGVAVLLHSRRIWAGPDAATSDWLTFTDYSAGTHLATSIAMAVAMAMVLGFLFLSRLSRRSVVSEGDDHPTIAD